jgi:homoserine O-acetyltransferase
LVISLEHDQLYTYAEQALLAKHIPNAMHQLISTRYGHDGFLIETQAMAALLNRFLKPRC